MDKNRQATDIDRKLAIYYHPLFQEVIKNILLLFKIPENNVFEIGLLEFVEFNLKLQKSLLPSFEIENALVSALNDWVKQVAECLSYEGMVSTSKCEQITTENFTSLLEKELSGIYIKPFAEKDEFIKTMIKLGSHDAFKLLGVKINKEVFNKFMFDLCSTWCQFLDIELFSYFLIAIYIQLSEGQSLEKSSFRKTSLISTIDLEFMQEFEQIKAMYSKNRKKDLRYYRAWCEWNYLRINEVGQSLILQLDQIHDNDPRILELALIFQKAIQVINDQITNQNQPKQDPPIPFQASKTEEKEGEFLVAKKIGVSIQRDRRESQPRQISKQSQFQQPETEDQIIHNFEIQIDAEGNMYLKKVVKLPVIGTKVELEPYDRKMLIKMRYLQRKKQQIREISNLYRRMQNMKVRLEHNVKNDPYNYKELPKVIERDEFYQKQDHNKPKDNKNQYTNLPIDKIIHGKIQPPPELTPPQPKGKDQYKQLFKPQLLEQRQPIHKNEDYIHKVMAPGFLTDQQNNVSFSKGEGSIYGVGPYAEKRDIKLGLPRIRHLSNRIDKIQSTKTYHLVGKLIRDRAVINERVKSFSTTQPPINRLEKQREQFKHVWRRYITDQQMGQLTNYNDFYSKLEEAKKRFSKDYQSEYRLNLKQILLYDNKRYEMGGVIDKKQQEKFYERIRKLIKRDQRRQQKKKRRTKLRQYRRAVGGKHNKKLYQDIFISYHRTAINEIKEERKHASMVK